MNTDFSRSPGALFHSPRNSLKKTPATMKAAGDTTAPMPKAHVSGILVVDDQAPNREVAKAFLERSGYAVETAADSLAAMSALQKKRYGLVLMDIRMPVIDGLAASRAIRKLDHPSRDIPILAATSCVTEDDIAEFHAAGMNGYVLKPYKPAELIAVVSKSLTPSQIQPQPIETVTESIPLDQSKLQEMVLVLGPERVGKITENFAQQLDRSFMSTPAKTRREAHDLINIAGVLGLDEFAALCRTIHDDKPASRRKYEVLIAKARRMKASVLRLCHDEIIPALQFPM